MTITEASGAAITGSLSKTTTSSGIASFTGLTFSTSGVKSLKVTSGSANGYSSVTVSQTPTTVTTATSGDLIVNHYFIVATKCKDAVGDLVLSSQSGTLTGSIGGTTTGTSSTGVISYSIYSTISGTLALSITHCGVTNSVNISIGKNIAIITPTKDWAQEPDTFTYTIYLKYSIFSNEVITITPDTSQFTASPTSLTFTSANYATKQTVTVTAKETS